MFPYVRNFDPNYPFRTLVLHPIPGARLPPCPAMSSDEFEAALHAALRAAIEREYNTPLDCGIRATADGAAADARLARELAAWLRDTIGIVDMPTLLARSVSHDSYLTMNLWSEGMTRRGPLNRELAARAVVAMRKDYDEAMYEAKKAWREEVEGAGHTYEGDRCHVCDPYVDVDPLPSEDIGEGPKEGWANAAAPAPANIRRMNKPMGGEGLSPTVETRIPLSHCKQPEVVRNAPTNLVAAYECRVATQQVYGIDSWIYVGRPTTALYPRPRANARRPNEGADDAAGNQ